MSVENYVTCPQGHKIFVIYSEEKRTFAFTCDICEEHSAVALSPYGNIRIVKTGFTGQVKSC